MRIAVTATEPAMEARVDPRFGRCPYIVIVETDTLAFEAIENPNVNLGGGAGIQTGQLMAEKDVEFVLTGNCGPNAHSALSAAGIGVVVGCSGTVRDVVEQFKAGQFNAAAGPNVASHFGTAGPTDTPSGQPVPPQQPGMPGGGAAMGPGMGGGMGMGRGMGRGMGMGRGRGRGVNAGLQEGGPVPGGPGAAPPGGATGLSKEEQLSILKRQAEEMSQQLQQLLDRIQQFEQE